MRPRLTLRSWKLTAAGPRTLKDDDAQASELTASQSINYTGSVNMERVIPRGSAGGRAGWSLTSERIVKTPEGLDLPALLERPIDAYRVVGRHVSEPADETGGR